MTGIIFNNGSLNKQIKNLTIENENLYDIIYNFEIQVNNLDQYSRRSSIEIRNISEKINQYNLEKYVSKVLDSIEIKLQSYDVVAVHSVWTYNGSVFYKITDSEDDAGERAYHMEDVLNKFEQLPDWVCPWFINNVKLVNETKNIQASHLMI